MNIYINKAFARIFRIYKKWGDIDAYYHSAFILGILFASTMNLVCAILFYYLQYDFLKFDLFPVGILLILVILFTIYYFYSNKEMIEGHVICKNKQERKNLLLDTILILMFTTWFITPFVYKMGI